MARYQVDIRIETSPDGLPRAVRTRTPGPISALLTSLLEGPLILRRMSADGPV